MNNKRLAPLDILSDPRLIRILSPMRDAISKLANQARRGRQKIEFSPEDFRDMEAAVAYCIGIWEAHKLAPHKGHLLAAFQKIAITAERLRILLNPYQDLEPERHRYFAADRTLRSIAEFRSCEQLDVLNQIDYYLLLVQEAAAREAGKTREHLTLKSGPEAIHFDGMLMDLKEVLRRHNLPTGYTTNGNRRSSLAASIAFELVNLLPPKIVKPTLSSLVERIIVIHSREKRERRQKSVNPAT